jgi:Flp pilus assembly protein TadD
LIADVEPGDHYVHVNCPGEAEVAYFISPRPGENAQIQASKEVAQAASTATEPSTVAEDKIELRRLVQQAVQLRVRGRLDEAVAALRQAIKLDPENSDLHRELGITFLLAKEWKRARVEMIEALRHDQTDADAHNGLGYALEKLGDLDGAVKEYRAATNLDPDDPTYRSHYFDAMVKITERQEKKK